jgi:hypothetical protein
MLLSIKQLYGDKLGASDGDLGHVQDFYFDDRANWAIRYVVVDTGTWLPGRQVLLSPHAFGSLDQSRKRLSVNLTRKQIEDSPPIGSHKPVSRQYEEEYHRHYGWPSYWLGDGLWGLDGMPILEPPVTPFPSEPVNPTGLRTKSPDAHLRSTLAVVGYHLQASDGQSGHVADFLMDARSWAIRQLVIRIGHRLSGREVLLATDSVDRISYEESTVSVDLTKAAVESGSSHPSTSVGGHVPDRSASAATTSP